MLHNFEYAWNITENCFFFLITEGILQCHSGNLGFYFPGFHILSTLFSELSFSQNLHVISPGNAFFLQDSMSTKGIRVGINANAIS